MLCLIVLNKKKKFSSIKNKGIEEILIRFDIEVKIQRFENCKNRYAGILE